MNAFAIRHALKVHVDICQQFRRRMRWVVFGSGAGGRFPTDRLECIFEDDGMMEEKMEEELEKEEEGEEREGKSVGGRTAGGGRRGVGWTKL